MNKQDLEKAFVLGKLMQHKKGGKYRVICIGNMKIDGAWKESCTYQDINSLAFYTREVDNFKKMSLYN